jgi:hypothetical protein
VTEPSGGVPAHGRVQAHCRRVSAVLRLHFLPSQPQQVGRRCECPLGTTTTRWTEWAMGNRQTKDRRDTGAREGASRGEQANAARHTNRRAAAPRAGSGPDPGQQTRTRRHRCHASRLRVCQPQHTTLARPDMGEGLFVHNTIGAGQALCCSLG